MTLRDLARELDLRAAWNEEQHRLRGSQIRTPEGYLRSVDATWRSHWLDEAETLREAAQTLREMIDRE